MKKRGLFILAGTCILVLASCGAKGAVTSATETSEQTTTAVMETTTLPQTTSKATTTTTATGYPTDPDYKYQKYVFGNVGNAPTAWEHYTGSGVTIAVIDSGFDYEHPEFYFADGTSKVSDLSCYISTNDGTTNVDVGKDTIGITDGESHGTMCAGLAGAANNGVGITGMAPDCTLLLIKVDKKPASFAMAYRYAADNGARVISISLGDYQNDGGGVGDIVYSAGEDISHAFDADIEYAYNKGAVICAAAGNSYSTEPTYPAACPYVLGIGGVKANDQHLIWKAEGEGSNYNGDFHYVDVCAPSMRIYGPIAKGSEHSYGNMWCGTSFAAPLVAGAAALYFEQNPEASNADFEQKLSETCFDLSTTNTEDLGYGQLDVVALLGLEA